MWIFILFSRIGYQIPLFAGFCIMFVSTISKCHILLGLAQAQLINKRSIIIITRNSSCWCLGTNSQGKFEGKFGSAPHWWWCWWDWKRESALRGHNPSSHLSRMRFSWVFQVFLVWSSAQTVVNSHGRAVLQGPGQADTRGVYQRDCEAAVALE